MTLNVHLVNRYHPNVINYLKEKLDPGIRLTVGDELPPEGDIHILIAGRPNRELFEASQSLHTIIVPWTGIPPETLELALQFPYIAVHNLHHNAVPVAEMSVTLLLAAAKRIIPFDEALRLGDWTLRYLEPAPSLTLKGKTVLVLGYGEIGRRVAIICHALGMKVWVIKRNPMPDISDQYVQNFFLPDKLHDLLPTIHALIVTLPLTNLTKDLIGERELNLMIPKSILVNIGRGLIINEEALYYALKNGRIGAAGLDVWYNYPPDENGRSSTFPSKYPFWELDNVVMSPHRAGLTDDINYLRMDHLAVLLNTAARGEEIPNKIDLRLGY